MTLHILSTGSKGNCYLLGSDNNEVLMLDMGVPFKNIKQALDFDLNKAVGALLTHSHKDHSKYAKDVLNAGIKVYSSKETFAELGLSEHHNAKGLEHLKKYQIDSFTVIPFDLVHDVRCFGYLIDHKEMGLTCFITDTHYSPYKFKGLNNIIIEANYSEKIIDEKLKEDKWFLRDRIIESHQSLETCIKFLKNNDLGKVNNIVLIHLSDSNSDETMFELDVLDAVKIRPHIAHAGMEIDFDLYPF